MRMKRQAWVSAVLVAAVSMVGVGRGFAAVGSTSGAESTQVKWGNGEAGIDEAMKSDVDVWGEAALKRPEGPTYEYFEKLLPPLRYVDADFKCYPIVLSAPNAEIKGRLISDGSCVNALARQANWHGETGVPVKFYIGDKREVFGSDLGRLAGPTYAEGYLPIAQFQYTTVEGAVFAEEAFAPVDEKLAAHGTVFVKFTLVKSSGLKRRTKPAMASGDKSGAAAVAGVESAANAALNQKEYDEKLEARFETGEVNLMRENRVLSGGGKDVLGLLYPLYSSAPGRSAIVAPMLEGESAYLAVFTKPMAAGEVGAPMTPELYDAERQRCVKTWDDILARGMVVETPERVVNDAWRAAVIGDYELFSGNQIHYSAGNQYAKRYIGEGCDTLRATAMWGQIDDARRLMPAQFQYTRKGLEYHQAALKLQMLAHYFQLTRDVAYVQKIRPMWEKEISVILGGREKDTGMLPREKYCGDIAALVYSLNSNSNCWRALRDMSVMLGELGETQRAEELATTAAGYRKVILAAIEKATRRDVNPPFVPIALSGEEDPPKPIWGSTIGSYWNLMIEYVLGSGVFTPESQTCTDVLSYIQQNSGLCMGIVRARAESLNFWVSGGRLNDLYGMRYALTLQRRDEPDRALVSFYGKLAQGMTRGTFIGCEGSSIASVDEYGRQMYLPPNSAGNSNYLQQLRYLLVQDYDLNDDGKAETLRLLFATPRAWMGDGKEIRVSHAPTAFGEVSLTAKSQLKEGRVVVDVELPKGGADKKLVRLRLPDGYHVTSAEAAGKMLPVEKGETIDISTLRGKVTVTAKVAR